MAEPAGSVLPPAVVRWRRVAISFVVAHRTAQSEPARKKSFCHDSLQTHQTEPNRRVITLYRDHDETIDPKEG